MNSSVPTWTVFAAGLAFGCSGFLAIKAAQTMYGSIEPPPGRTAPAAGVLALPIVIAAVIGSVFAARGASFPALAEIDVVFFALCAAIWSDLARGMVGNRLVLPAIALVVTLGALHGRLAPVALSGLFVTAPFALAALVSKAKGFGWGDVKLAALGSVVLDAQTTLLVYAIACFVAIATAYAVGKRREPIAFAPYLAGAIALGLVLPVAHPVPPR